MTAYQPALLGIGRAEPNAPAQSQHAAFLDLPARTQKPRSHGLTIVIHHGAATRAFGDVVVSHAGLIDLVKFGWGTCLVTKDMREKVGMLQAASIGYCFGGTLFEKAVWQRRLDAYIALCREFSCPAVEVSDGTIELPRADKIARI